MTVMNNKSVLVNRLESIEEIKPTFLAIGVFDGVHRGHQYLLQNMVTAAREAGAQAAVLTFFPHPSSVIHDRHGRIYLNTLQERISLLSSLDLDMVITQSFDDQLRQTPASEFVSRLCHHLGLSQLWGGAFSLGFNREGDLPFLQKMGQDRGFAVHQVESMVEWEGQRVSSSRMRQALRAGKIDEVNGCLGHRYSLTGTVIHGDGRGGPLGIPTANLLVWEELLLPANGVYATYALHNGRKYRAATNIGIRPTVDGHSLNVEAHLLDFNADIYDQELTLEFVSRVRDEQKFPGLEALVSQIQVDIATIRAQLPLDTSS
jgi:riboflavin kinase/FMN adenylyltransferase